MTTVEKIKELCKEQRTTIAAIERECGFANGSIRKWDKSPTTYERLLKVANTLNTTVEYLRGETEQKKEPTPKKESGQGLPEGYDKLTPENKAIVDRLIVDLANTQSKH